MKEILSAKKNILDFDPDELVGIVVSWDQKPFRAKQIFGWLAKGVPSFSDMKNLPADLRTALEEEYIIDLPKAVLTQKSENDGTVKCLFEYRDGSRVESVFMKYEYGNSVCISSQVGCRMGCKFCASTKKGLERSLTGGEMLGQVLAMKNLTGESIGHVVVMGIGEPFDNYENLLKFIRLIHEPSGCNLGLRNITVSTCGLVPEIFRFAEDLPQVNLAVSFHAPNDEIRRKTMPVAKRYPMEALLSACCRYTEKTGRRVSFEYALIEGVNDSRENAAELAGRLSGMLAHVNLIPLNSVDGTGLSGTGRKGTEAFKKELESFGIAVTVRRTLGDDIDAACGQLRLR